MILKHGLKFQSYVHFWEHLPQNERIVVDYLRDMVLRTLPPSSKEKLAYNVPFYYGNRRICLIWPASVPNGGIKSGVLFGFSQGNRLDDPNRYLIHGTNKQVYYQIYHHIDEIDEKELIPLLNHAIEVDQKCK